MDTAGSLGFGIICKEQWAFGEWPEAWKTKNIVILELYHIILAVHMFGDCFQNHSVIFHTDNEAVMHIVNKHTSKDNQTMTLVRDLVLTCLHKNIAFSAKHIPIVLNIGADLFPTHNQCHIIWGQRATGSFEISL